MSSIDEIKALSERLNRAYEESDYDTMREICSPDFTAWYSYQKVDLSLEQMIAQASELLQFAKPGSFRVRDVGMIVTPQGWIQRLNIQCTSIDGVEVNVDECMLYDVVDGRIARLEQYNDFRDIEPLAKHLPPESRY